MKSYRFSVLRGALLAASAITFTGTAQAADTADASPDLSSTPPPGGIVRDPGIVVRNDLDPNATPPSGVVDTGVNGIGQVVTDAGGGSVGLCTATLINPRTVIFAAHCVNTRAASAYGGNTGGTGISIHFGDNTLAGVRRWLGLDGGTRYASDAASNYFNINQIWYDPRSRDPNSCTSATSCFLQADVAIGTLDAPASEIPAWVMLFSPLSGPTHGVVTGYGNRGNSASTALGVDWRRRSAENMISLLGSLDDVDNWLFGTAFTDNPQNLYQASFNDPNPGYNPTTAARKFDFGIFGDSALPREGTTAPGDSGGPLIADQAYDRAVVVGVLSGGSRFFSAQRSWEYGTTSFYQPLYLFWEEIVANNPYVYAGAKQGVGAWENPNHWVQLMDPSYMIDVDGQLVNGLPTFRSDGVAGNGPKFGQVCFLTDCNPLADEGSPLNDTGAPVLVPGGPGSTGFVPNNVDPVPASGVRARYYDVTLSQIGTTSLSSSVTIDRMTLTGRSPRLDVRPNGTLTVLGDYTQMIGTTNVDGRINAGETLMVSGLLSGSGTFNPTFLTVGVGTVSPGGLLTPGTLTIQGDVILSSASILNIELTRNATDLLRVTGDSQNPGILALNGGAVQFGKAVVGLAPRHGDSFVFATAAGGVDGTFNYVYSNLGVLNPVLTYGANDVSVQLQAGSLAGSVAGVGGGGGVAGIIASILDLLRGNSYNNLYGLYGAIDVMDPLTLAGTLRALAPDAAVEGYQMDGRHSRMLMNNITDRLSMLGTLPGGTLSVSTDSGLFAAMAGDSAPATLGFSSIVPSRAGIRALPQGVTGFVTSGYSVAGTTLGSDRLGSYGGQRTLHVGMGLETEVAPGFTMGTAFGFADGLSRPGATSRSETRTSQVAAYGSYRLGGGAYVAAVASADMSRFDLARDVTAGLAPTLLNGATETSRLTARAEAGVNLAVSRGLTLTPRVAVAYSSYRLGGFREQGGEAALQFDEMNLQQLESRMGVALSGQTVLPGGWRFIPQIRGDVVRLLSGADDGMMVRFANAPAYAFALPLYGGDSTWGEVRGGWRLANGPLEFGAALEANIGRASFRDERAVGDITFRF